jgi:hypothetical protein
VFERISRARLHRPIYIIFHSIAQNHLKDSFFQRIPGFIGKSLGLLRHLWYIFDGHKLESIIREQGFLNILEV